MRTYSSVPAGGWNTGDLFKEFLYVKVVPDANPDADGEWVMCFVAPRGHTLSYLSSLLPEGEHAVAQSWRQPWAVA